MGVPFKNKKYFKQTEGRCQICKEKEYALMDTHRIKEGGKYNRNNSVCLCVKCHRKVTNGKITTLGWVNSTKGKLLHIVDEDGIEKFV